MAAILRLGEQKAIFEPDQGMALVSFSKGQTEVLDPKSRQDFDHYRAGLGALIGPHFYLQKKEWIVPVQAPSLFPHLKYTQALGFADPFSHGLGRYARWSYTATDHSLSASLSGRDVWHGKPCMHWEGVDFDMHIEAKLTLEGLALSMTVSSPRECLTGLHYYYALPPGDAWVTSEVQDRYNDGGVFKPMRQNWIKDSRLHFDLHDAADFGFLPTNGRSGKVLLNTSQYKLSIAYQGSQDEVSWQLYHPQGASFVCIEPMSVQNPLQLSTRTSSLTVQIAIL